jgi:hypothetical protein
MAEKLGLINWVPNGWALGVGSLAMWDYLSFSERLVPAFLSGFIGQNVDQIPERVSMLEVIKSNEIEVFMASRVRSFLMFIFSFGGTL